VVEISLSLKKGIKEENRGIDEVESLRFLSNGGVFFQKQFIDFVGVVSWEGGIQLSLSIWSISTELISPSSGHIVSLFPISGGNLCSLFFFWSGKETGPDCFIFS